MVLDTNAVLDLWAFADARVQVLRAAMQAGELDWVGTPDMRLELQHVLSRGVGAGYGAAPDAVLAHWDRWARPWPPTETTPVQPASESTTTLSPIARTHAFLVRHHQT